MEQGDISLFFLYDQNGLFGFDKISGTTKNTFYYRIDARGEIVAIVNAYGNVVANYTYDAWGNPISVTNGSGNSDLDSTHVALLNPFRYKSYVYDNETELYYLNSRYYDPQVCRFVSRDEFSVLTATPTALTDKNLFAYCDNNPVMRADTNGYFWSELSDFANIVVAEIGKALRAIAPAYSTCSGVALSDGPLPFGDTVAAAAAVAITVVAVGTGVYNATQSVVIAFPKTKTKENITALPRIPDAPLIFPKNPHEFNPTGLIKVHRPGTKNGALISWMDPINDTEIFRWDENINYPNGSHYHIKGEGHYVPGVDNIPEPYATIYFPLR